MVPLQKSEKSYFQNVRKSFKASETSSKNSENRFKRRVIFTFGGAHHRAEGQLETKELSLSELPPKSENLSFGVILTLLGVILSLLESNHFTTHRREDVSPNEGIG